MFVAAAQTFVVPPELWDRPRSGQAVNACLAQPDARLVVHQGAGLESLLAAEELRSWLTTLAVEPKRISLRGGLISNEPLRLEVVRD